MTDLPDGHLEDGPPVLPVVVAEERHVGEEELLDLLQPRAGLRLTDERGHHLQDHRVLQPDTVGFSDVAISHRN